MANEPLVYTRNDYRPEREANITIYDIGFTWGVTITERCRTFRQRVFRLDDHVRRFRASCYLAHVRMEKGFDELQKIAKNLVAHNAKGLSPSEELTLVMFATPGGTGKEVGPIEPVTLVMHTFPLSFVSNVHMFRDGARLITPSVRQVPAHCVDPRIKHRSRLHFWLAEHEVSQTYYAAHALLLDGAGCATETAAANFLIVKGGIVQSPPRTSILNGISLLVTEEICNDLSIPFREQPLPLADCLAADEALLTSTPYGIVGVRQLNDVVFRWPGPIFRRLLAAWNAQVGLDIEEQFLAHDVPRK
jgi:branched-subunit amino acid aminotransferase/4-amino-4-deoxychorismate lyase